MPALWTWLLHTDAGLMTRIGIGAGIFLILALVDLRRHGPRATRWREYLFLLAGATVAMIYGALNDSITSQISWEYFVYGKGLLAKFNGQLPPSGPALTWEAAKVGIKAAWSVGLIIAVAMLMANNPGKNLPQIPYRKMMPLLAGIIGCCVLFALALGIAGNRGLLVGCSRDFAEMVERNEFRPYRFMTAYGVHLGGYLGGAIGTVWAVIMIRRMRKSIGAATTDHQDHQNA